MTRQQWHPSHPNCIPENASFGDTREYKPYGTPFIYNSNEINKDGYKSPVWVKRVERMASKKGEGRAALRIPRNKNSQKYQDFLQKKINKVYSRFNYVK